MEGIAIRIELNGKENEYGSCSLELSDSGIVQIVCENAKQRAALIALITGVQVEDGICQLGDTSTRDQLKQYKRKVDMIDMDRLDSTLNVKRYLAFYAMVAGIYDESVQEEIDKQLVGEGLEHLSETALNEIEPLNKIKVRAVASSLKHIQCLVGRDLLTELTREQQDVVLTFLKEHIVKKQGLCLLFEQEPREDIGEIRVLSA
ncbi:MAG: hypothetical protein E7290_07280 [Lachnospiraceae bacterium]|nr:hypothetical protein [Lachnospiraceae bacterium]